MALRCDRSKERQMATRWDERFFASTRGQVIGLIRRGVHTVDELASALGLTDNAIRGHLTALERDGLVRQGVRRRTGRKPSYTYYLTDEAERLFPRAYGLLLARLLRLLEDRLPPNDLERLLRDLGHELAGGQPVPAGDLRERVEVERAQGLLAGMGGLSELEAIPGGYRIVGCSCPLAAAVEGSAGACLIAEALLSDLTGATVRQQCDPGPPPRCRFDVLSSSV
jgi:predicted ArsR family transcriptional regulator